MRDQEQIAKGQSSQAQRRRDLIRALLDQSGQDLIEYALLLSLVGLAATAGMQSVASKVSAAYSNIGTAFAANVGTGNSASPGGGTGNGNGVGNGQGNNGNNSGNGNSGDNGNGTGNGNNGKGKG